MKLLSQGYEVPNQGRRARPQGGFSDKERAIAEFGASLCPGRNEPVLGFIERIRIGESVRCRQSAECRWFLNDRPDGVDRKRA